MKLSHKPYMYIGKVDSVWLLYFFKSTAKKATLSANQEEKKEKEREMKLSHKPYMYIGKVDSVWLLYFFKSIPLLGQEDKCLEEKLQEPRDNFFCAKSDQVYFLLKLFVQRYTFAGKPLHATSYTF